MTGSLSCRHCREPVAAWSRCCDLCGAPLARLCWRSGNTWKDAPILLVIGRGNRQLHVEVQNDGPAPIWLVLPQSELARFPAWLERESALTEPIQLEAGQQHRLPILINQAALEAVFSGIQRGAPGERGRFEIPLRSTLATPNLVGPPGRQTLGWTPTVIHLHLLVAREPRLSPRHVILPFLSRRRLERDACVIRLDLQNETAEPLRLRSIQIQELPDSLRADAPDRSGLPFQEGVVRCPKEELEQRAGPGGALSPSETAGAALALLEPQEGLSLAVQVVPPGAVAGAGAGAFRFSACIQMELSVGLRPSWIDAVIEGVVGDAPDVVFDGGARQRVLELVCDTTAEARARIRNPGSIPVRLRFEVETGAGAAIQGQDWLEWVQPPPDRLGPGQEVELRMAIHAGRRSPEEMAADTCIRAVRILHDGEGDGEGGGWREGHTMWRAAGLRLVVRFQATLLDNDLYLGIDFGTSGSIVCAIRKEHWAVLPVDAGGLSDSRGRADAGLELPSLLFFSCAQDDLQPPSPQPALFQPFLIGSEARAAAIQNPTNLVRSIKTVVARDPGHTFHFECRDPANPGTLHLHPWKTQQLLDTFIRMLREQAERLIAHLEPDAFRELLSGLSAVRFTRAVFTHPVDVPAHARDALFAAAQQAGLDSHLETVGQFFGAACVDEATAAVLGYLWLRARGTIRLEGEGPYGEVEGVDPALERVLCVDIGGGTTDIAAVEIADLAAFRAGAADQVLVRLMAVNGDARIGGDEIDLRLARLIVDRLQAGQQAGQQAGRSGLPLIDAEEIRRALLTRSPSEYRQQYESRQQARRAPGTAPAADEARDRFAKAMELRGMAEAAKRVLNRQDQLDLSVSTAVWPAIPAPAGAPAGALSEALTVRLTRADLLEVTRPDMERQAALLSEAVQSAGWAWGDITTLLFTGQGSRLDHLRSYLHTFILEQRGPVPIPILIEPDHPGFDPKSCVALGAAVWGAAQESPRPWLRLESRLHRQLTFDLQFYVGVRFLTVLHRGAPFPVEASSPSSPPSMS